MEKKMRNPISKTATVLAALVLGLGVLGAAAPSYADNNGSLAFVAFPPDGVVKLGLGASASDQYSAYYPSNAGRRAISAPTQFDWGQIDYNSNSHSLGTH
jgi:hypothetical protein